MTEFEVPTETVEAEIEIKKSRFIAYLARTCGVKEAKQFLAKIKSQHPDARHHCYAHIAGSPSNSNLYGFSDDNEPSGTAGMPIFTHLKHSGLGETTIVVVRYFGGTKLGTGGLARAYGDAAGEALKRTVTQRYVAKKMLELRLAFHQESDVRHAVSSLEGQILKVNYSQTVNMTIEVAADADLNLPYSVEVLSLSEI